MNRAAGFGLLEAIVAMAILATTGLTLLSWLQQAQDTQRRQQISQAESELRMTAQALMANVNPYQRPTGRTEIGHVAVEWTSTALTPHTPGQSAVEDTPSPWELAVFRLNVSARDISQGVAVSFKMLRTGFRPSSAVSQAGAGSKLP